MNKSKLFKSCLTAIVVVAFGAPAVASVGDSDELDSVSISVSYADLNLQNEEGAVALYRRLKQASKRACDFRGLNIAGSVSQMLKSRQCYISALTGAVEQMDNDLVTSLHNS
jgi:UrcA family protein